jgi:hypothetical protein
VCWFVRLVLPSEAAVEKLRPALGQHGLQFDRIAADGIVVRPGELVGRATRGHCDCATELGAETHQNHQQKIAALRRKGWSEARIERWRAETTRAAARPRPSDGTTPDLASWVAFLRQVSADRQVSYVGLLIQWNSDAVTAEATHPVSEAGEGFLSSMSREVLYRLAVRPA